MSYKVSSFVYFVQDLSEYFESFIERLMSQLALRGTAITDQRVEEDLAKMNVKYTDETGSLVIVPVGKDIKAVYQVAGGGTVRRGVWGALRGAGLTSIVSTLFEEDRKDRLIQVAGGMVAGGASGVYDGYNRAMNEATQFSKTLADAVQSVEGELRTIKRGKEAAVEARREEKREIKEILEEAYVEFTTLNEEVELAQSEGKDVTKAQERLKRAETLLGEAEEALNSGKELQAKAKVKASSRMIELAREVL